VDVVKSFKLERISFVTSLLKSTFSTILKECAKFRPCGKCKTSFAAGDSTASAPAARPEVSEGATTTAVGTSATSYQEQAAVVVAAALRPPPSSFSCCCYFESAVEASMHYQSMKK